MARLMSSGVSLSDHFTSFIWMNLFVVNIHFGLNHSIGAFSLVNKKQKQKIYLLCYFVFKIIFIC